MSYHLLLPLENLRSQQLVTSRLQSLMDTVKILLLLCYEVVQLRYDFKFQAQMCSLHRLTVPNLTILKTRTTVFTQAIYLLNWC